MTKFGVHRRAAGGHVTAAAVLIAAAVALSACSSSSGGATSSGAGASIGPNPNPTVLDSIVVNGSNPVLTLDNAKAGDITSLVATYWSQGMLYHIAPDGTTFTPDLVDKDGYSADGLTFTITLKSGLKYSDGTPVTAKDVVAAYNHGKAGLWGSTILASIKSVEATSDLEVKFNLRYADPDLRRELTERAMAINPADKVASDPDYFNHPVSAGPFMVQNYVAGQKDVVLVQNPNYWGGPSMTKKITIAGVADEATRTLQIQSGQIDLAWKVPYAAVDTVKALATVESARIGGYMDLYINGRASDAPLDKADVRKAISLALDREAISQTVYKGILPARTSYMWSCGDACQPGLLPNQGKQDIAAAKDLLAQAGVTTPLNVVITTTTADQMPDAAVVVQNQLKQVGINATIKQLDAAAGSAALHAGQFQIYLGEGAQATAGAGLLTFFSSTAYNSLWTGIADTTLNDLAIKASQELDQAKRKTLYTELQTKANDVMPIVPLLERAQVNSYAKKLPEGFANMPKNTQMINIQTVAEAKAGKHAGE